MDTCRSFPSKLKRSAFPQKLSFRSVPEDRLVGLGPLGGKLQGGGGLPAEQILPGLLKSIQFTIFIDPIYSQ